MTIPTSPAPVEARETSGATTALVLGYLRERGGPAAVEDALHQLLRKADIAMYSHKNRDRGGARH